MSEQESLFGETPLIGATKITTCLLYPGTPEEESCGGYCHINVDDAYSRLRKPLS